MFFSSCFKSTFEEPVLGPLTLNDKDSTVVNTRVDADGSNLPRLRGLMLEHKLTHYCVPSTDAHNTEFVGDHDKRLAFISGFSGSTGNAIITMDHAYLFVDGRYWLQAEQQVSKDWSVMKVGSPGVLDWQDHLLQYGHDSDRVGLNDTLYTYRKSFLQSIRQRHTGTGITEHDRYTATITSLINLTRHKGIDIAPQAVDLVDQIWGNEQPARNATSIFCHPLQFAGASASSKVGRLRNYIADNKGKAYLVSDLSELAWLLNLRASDIENSPVFYAYALVTVDMGTTLFVDAQQVKQVEAYLVEDLKVTIKPYEAVLETLSDMDWSAGPCFMASSASFALYRAVGADHVVIVTSPLATWRAIKNEIELQGQRAAYVRDAVAWARWAADLEGRLKKTKVTEYEAAELLVQYAQQGTHWFSPSYEPIVGSGKNGASPHYAPTKDKSDVIDLSQPVVVDIGQQYLDATTDTTRTFHFDPKRATLEQKQAFTRVLQGHMAIDTAIFPAGTPGCKLDPLARIALWKNCQDYTHGTGHGIGSFLNVHEGPQSISSSLANTTPLQVGHILSNEPGYYDAFGVRIESAVAVRSVRKQNGLEWLGFERLTRVPIQASMVDPLLMSSQELKWLSEHNALCKKDILPLLKHVDRRAYNWLKAQ